VAPNPHATLTLQFPGSGATRTVNVGEPLPAESFQIRSISVRENATIDRETFFSHLVRLQHLELIGDPFNRLKWTDADFARLANKGSGSAARNPASSAFTTTPSTSVLPDCEEGEEVTATCVIDRTMPLGETPLHPDLVVLSALEPVPSTHARTPGIGTSSPPVGGHLGRPRSCVLGTGTWDCRTSGTDDLAQQAKSRG